MIDAASFIGEPTDFMGICLIYPPKIKEMITSGKFFKYYRFFTFSQEDVAEEIKKMGLPIDTNVPPLHFLIDICKNDKGFEEAVLTGLEYFLHEKAMILYEQKVILIGEISSENLSNLENLRLITNNNYFDFQNAIRRSVGFPEEKPPVPIDPDEDPRIRKMKEKIRERDRVKAKKAAEGKADGISLSTSLAAICCMGIGLTPLNIGEMSYAAVAPLTKMMQEKEKYDLDIHSILAGADPKKVKPKYWIREFEKD